MAKNLETRPWKDIGAADRAVRLVMYVGAAGFLGFWLISFRLEGTARLQPNASTGIYQFPYYHKGHINYLTEGQASLAHWGNILAYGWGFAFVAGCYTVLSEKRAAQRRTDIFLSHHNPGHENTDH